MDIIQTPFPCSTRKLTFTLLSGVPFLLNIYILSITLNEFNNIELDEKYHFIWHSKEGEGISCFRDDGDYKYILWNCREFYAETCAIKVKAIKMEGFELNDKRINFYIDWIQEHKDDPKYQIS